LSGTHEVSKCNADTSNIQLPERQKANNYNTYTSETLLFPFSMAYLNTATRQVLKMYYGVLRRSRELPSQYFF